MTPINLTLDLVLILINLVNLNTNNFFYAYIRLQKSMKVSQKIFHFYVFFSLLAAGATNVCLFKFLFWTQEFAVMTDNLGL